MVFQDPNSSLNPRRRVGDQIRDGLAVSRRRGLDITDTPESLLEQVDLPASTARKYPHQLSGGQKQRIATARALAARPDLLVADEPISALDASTQARVATLMRNLCRDFGVGLLFISHDLSVVRIVADRLLVMYKGPHRRKWTDSRRMGLTPARLHASPPRRHPHRRRHRTPTCRRP